MKLLDQQKLLANLFTQQKMREEYFTNPLVKRELNEKQVDIFARSLILKRMNAVKSWLPLSFAFDEKKLSSLFIGYASDNPIQGLHLKHQRDVLGFYDFIKRTLGQNLVEGYHLAIIKYEVFHLKRYLPGKRFLLLVSGYRWHRVPLQTVYDKDKLLGKTIILMVRFFSHKRWLTWSIS